MKRIVPLVLCVVFGLMSALPALAQSGENKDWQEIEEMRDARRQAELIVTFIGKYSSSPHRPDADKMLVSYWVSNKDYAKIVNHADGFKTSLPSADAASKSIIYQQGMLAALSLNNPKKVTEFGQYALEADPKNFMVLGYLAISGLYDGKTSVDFAKRAAALPQPKTMAADQYNSLLTRVKALANGGGGGGGAAASPAQAVLVSAQALMNDKKYQEAIDAYQKGVKEFPKEAELYFNMAVAHYYIMGDAAQGAQAANDDQVKAMIATPVVQADVDKAAAKKEQFTKQALDNRDAAIDALARTLAIGGPRTAQAKQMFDALYLNKNKSADGSEQYIADKKKELGL